MPSLAAQQSVAEADADSKAAAVRQLLQAGRKALHDNDANAAVRAYREALSLEPNLPEALYQLAIYNFRRQNHRRGIDLIRRAVELAPKNPLPRLALAKGLSDVGEFEEAVEQYRQVLEVARPGSRPAGTAALEMHVLRFKLAARQRDREQVLEVGALLTARYRNISSILETVASVYGQAGLFEEAEGVYFQLQRLMPKNPQIEVQLAGLYEKMRESEKAIEHYRYAVEKGEGTPIEPAAQMRASLLKARLLLKEGDKEGAHKLFLKVLEYDEDNIVANMNIANYYQAQKKLDKAEEAYLHVIAAKPDHMEAHFRLALSYLDSGNAVSGVRELDTVLSNSASGTPLAQAAERALERVSQRYNLDIVREMVIEEQELLQRLEVNPGDAVALAAMGDLMKRRGRAGDALNYFERAMEADPSYVDAFVSGGRVLQHARQFEKAMNAYGQALTLISDEAEQRIIKERWLAASGSYYLNEGEFEKAGENFLQAYEMTQAYPDGDRGRDDVAAMLWGLAMVSSKRGELEEAAEWYEELIALVPNHVGARSNVAFVYEQLEEEEKASAHYNAVRVAQNSTPAMKERAERRLDYIRRQTNGFSYGVGYSMGFDDNLNSAQYDKFFEYRSSLFASAIYRYKLKKGMKLAVTFSPSYGVYHRAEYDFFNFSISPSLLVDKWGYDWNLGLSRNTSSSVLRPERSSTVTDTLNMGASWTVDDEVNYRLGMSYRGFGSSENPFFDSNTVNLNFNVSQPGSENLYLSYGYTLTVNNNKNSLGNDYAYTGQGINGRIDIRLNERLTGYLNGNLGMNLYHNPDSSTNFKHRRRTFRMGFGGGVNYKIDSWVSFFASYNYSSQYANLPVGFVFNELQSVEGRQSTSLGSFVRSSVSTGIRMSF